jgi:hypothetical protein
MYGGGNKIGRGMGNTSKGDAWKYRGRGFIQLTGKQQYSDASKSIFGDDRLVKDPDLANDPNVAAQIAADYLDRGRKIMAQKMGVDLQSGSQKDIDAVMTSVVAGRPIKPGDEGYLGKLLNQVNQYTATNYAPETNVPEKLSTPKPTTVAMNTGGPTMQPPSPTSGPQLAQQSTVNATMMKMAALEPPKAGGNVFAPQSSVTNNHSTSVAELSAKNTESTYQRNMDAMYSPT